MVTRPLTGASGFSKQWSFRGSDFGLGIQNSYLIQTLAFVSWFLRELLSPLRPAWTGTCIYPFLSQSVHPTNVLGM